MLAHFATRIRLILPWERQRTTLPSSLQGNVSTIDTSTLGIPVANWPADDCEVNEFFQPQEIVFDITLCGGACSFVVGGRVRVSEDTRYRSTSKRR